MGGSGQAWGFADVGDLKRIWIDSSDTRHAKPGRHTSVEQSKTFQRAAGRASE